MSEKVKTMSDPYKFINSKDTRDKLKMAAHNLQYTFERQDVQLVTAYAAAIIVYKNSQRSGVITNLTYKEYQMKKEKAPSTSLNVQTIRLGYKVGLNL